MIGLKVNTGDENLVGAQSFGHHYVEEADRTGSRYQTGLAHSDLRSFASVDRNGQRLDHRSFFIRHVIRQPINNVVNDHLFIESSVLIPSSYRLLERIVCRVNEVLGESARVRGCRVARDVCAQIVLAFFAGLANTTRNCRLSTHPVANFEALNVGADFDHFGTGLVTHNDGLVQHKVPD